MNRMWVAVVIIVLLAGGVNALGVLYWQKSEELVEAESDMATMGLNMSSLEKVKSGNDELISRLAGELATAETQVSTLQAELAAAQAEISRLEGELGAAED